MTRNLQPAIQEIEIIRKKAPLGKGSVFYFRCPVKGNACRILYFHNGQFLSRKAIENCHYGNQCQSRKQRNAMKDVKRLMQLQKTVNQGKRPYFKKFHAGEPTKRYIKILMAADDLNESW